VHTSDDVVIVYQTPKCLEMHHSQYQNDAMHCSIQNWLRVVFAFLIHRVVWMQNLEHWMMRYWVVMIEFLFYSNQIHQDSARFQRRYQYHGQIEKMQFGWMKIVHQENAVQVKANLRAYCLQS